MTVHPDELRDGKVREAPWRLRQVLRQADGCRSATAAWDASDDALRDATSDELRARWIAADANAEKLACPAPDDPAQDAARILVAARELCIPDAVRFAA